MENPIKMDDLGVPLFLETSIYTLEVSKTKSKLPGRGFGPSLEPFVSGGGSQRQNRGWVVDSGVRKIWQMGRLSKNPATKLVAHIQVTLTHTGSTYGLVVWVNVVWVNIYNTYH